jgi:transmembrane sensor
VAPSGAAQVLSSEIDFRLRRRRKKRLAVAGIGVAGLFALVLSWQGPAPVQPGPTPFTLFVAAPARQILPDGTMADLNTQASIAIEFTNEARKVSLLQGEAHFQVAKISHRPFIVSAGGVEFRAVGTAFAVQLGETEIELLVTEGVVAVDRSNHALSAGPSAATQTPTPGSAPLTVTAGNRVVVEVVRETVTPAAPRVVQVDGAELNERLAWRVPRVEFTSTPLRKVIPTFHEYSGIEIILTDPELAELELSGILRADNIDSLLNVLEEEFQVKAERRGGQIHLRR